MILGFALKLKVALGGWRFAKQNPDNPGFLYEKPQPPKTFKAKPNSRHPVWFRLNENAERPR
jgi:hypothetical protein